MIIKLGISSFKVIGDDRFKNKLSLELGYEKY